MTSIASSLVTPPTTTTPPIDFYYRAKVTAVPGSTISVFSIVVPALTTRNLTGLFITALNDGDFSLEANSIEIAAGRIDNVLHNLNFKFDPSRPIPAGVTIELKYTADSDPTFGCPITAFLSATDVT